MTKEELQNINVEKQEGSAVKIEGEVPFSYLEKHRIASVKHIGKDSNIDGFRKGHIPEKMLIERVGEMTILNEMAERALKDVYTKIIKEKELDVIGYPQINITKLAKDNPLGFTATVAIVPDITLPDYNQVAKDTNTSRESEEVTPKEVEAQINDVLRQKVAYERMQKKATEPSKKSSEDKKTDDIVDLPTPEAVQKNSSLSRVSESHDSEIEDVVLPKLTDELVKTLGKPGQFENVADFKEKIKEHLSIQKKQDVASQHRAKITDTIIEMSDIELPKILIDSEIGQMFGQMEDDLTRAELKIDDYLEHMKKTREDMIKEWTPAAEKRAKLQLILNEIAKKEGIKPNTGEVDHQVSHLLEQHKDADESRVRVYVESVLTNEAVMKKLESL